jgi:hypothetical protein
MSKRRCVKSGPHGSFHNEIGQEETPYDVLNEGGFPWFGVFFAIVPLLLATAYCFGTHRSRAGQAPTPPRVSGLYIIPSSGLIVFGAITAGEGADGLTLTPVAIALTLFFL